jgi:hypothetical protein
MPAKSAGKVSLFGPACTCGVPTHDDANAYAYAYGITIAVFIVTPNAMPVVTGSWVSADIGRR